MLSWNDVTHRSYHSIPTYPKHPSSQADRCLQTGGSQGTLLESREFTWKSGQTQHKHGPKVPVTTVFSLPSVATAQFLHLERRTLCSFHVAKEELKWPGHMVTLFNFWGTSKLFSSDCIISHFYQESMSSSLLLPKNYIRNKWISATVKKKISGMCRMCEV